ncbi:MAG: hypothetical protein LBR16_00055, partial [Treponema sp.]|nr:hypothetical protein [Treponema sp.]
MNVVYRYSIEVITMKITKAAALFAVLSLAAVAAASLAACKNTVVSPRPDSRMARVVLSVGAAAPARSIMPDAWGPVDAPSGNHADSYTVTFAPVGGGEAAV